jgi:hypothetical protein
MPHPRKQKDNDKKMERRIDMKKKERRGCFEKKHARKANPRGCQSHDWRWSAMTMGDQG